MKLKEYLLGRVDALENEFENILERGFGPDSPFYDYLEDLRTGLEKINER